MTRLENLKAYMMRVRDELDMVPPDSDKFYELSRLNRMLMRKVSDLGQRPQPMVPRETVFCLRCGENGTAGELCGCGGVVETVPF